MFPGKSKIDKTTTHGRGVRNPTMPPYIQIEPLRMEPCRLVMLPSRCFYCTAESTWDTEVHRLFGIRHCDTHQQDADRDVKDFLIANNIVRMQDAMDHDVLGPFLRGLGETFAVRRSSGVLEDGWFFNWTPPLREEAPVLRKSRQFHCWGVNVTNGSLDKFVAFRDLQHIPHVVQHLEEVLQVLNTGIY
jgi:hypothetical protein